jgi:hypothetical protein
MLHPFFEGAEVLSIYTRTQALEDGVLFDMTQEPFGDLARKCGIKWPVAMTATAFHECVAVSDTQGHCGQDIIGRWWDVLMTFRSLRREVSPLEVRWSVFVHDPDGRQRQKQLKCVSGPDDDGKPCLTFMLPNED